MSGHVCALMSNYRQLSQLTRNSERGSQREKDYGKGRVQKLNLQKLLSLICYLRMSQKK